MEKPICLITGATAGVGRTTAEGLASRGFTVVLAARDGAKAEAVAAAIARATNNPAVEYVVGDLRSLSQIRQLAQTFKARYPRLDILINNAGILMPDRVVTEDGYETMFQVNYLSQFYLTQLLLDELKNSRQGRVINLSSSVYRTGKFNPHNLQGEVRFSTLGAYSTSKLMVLLFTIELANRIKGTAITANAVHPGVVRTQMMLSAPGMFRTISYAALPFSVSVQKGASTSIYLASAADLADVSGQYFVRGKRRQVTSKFNTQENRSLLWGISLSCLQPWLAK
jgi:NAD(P)-dependent dehydrogenase (short-subunit alcohol dehydrogenase family)